MEGKSLAAIIIVVALASMMAGALVTWQFTKTLELHGRVGVDFIAGSIHSRITMFQNGVLILDEYHAGAVTDIGDNMTLAWIFGDSDYNVTQYLYNATYISIGNQGTLNTASEVLPGEWNRTAGTVEDENQSWLNITCTFYPDDSGPYTADCIGLNWRSGIGHSGNLWAYDTFTEVTGIDETFTINVEFKISVAHS